MVLWAIFAIFQTGDITTLLVCNHEIVPSLLRIQTHAHTHTHARTQTIRFIYIKIDLFTCILSILLWLKSLILFLVRLIKTFYSNCMHFSISFFSGKSPRIKIFFRYLSSSSFSFVDQGISQKVFVPRNFTCFF